MRYQTRGLRSSRLSAGAFTLVELLAVIAIIGIATALLLPAISKARSRAQSIACMSNLKGLELCMHLYVSDFNDYFVPNNSVSVFTANKANSADLNVTGMSWLPDEDAATEMNPSNIINGLLYQYNHSLPIYHCPADLARLETSDGRPLSRQLPNQGPSNLATSGALNGPQLAQLRWRSYNLSQSVNGYPQGDPEYFNIIPAWTKFTDVRHPRPSDLFVFLDENPDTMTDSEFGCPPIGSPYFWPNEWWDMPSDRHSQGANLSFVDGHVEHWKWVYPKVAYEQGQDVAAKEMPDYLRIQGGMKQLTDN